MNRKRALSSPRPGISPPPALPRLSSGDVLLVAASALIGLLLIVPLAVLLAQGIALRGWEEAQAVGLGSAIGLSLGTTLVSAVLIALLGTPLAYVLARRRFPGKTLLAVLVELPIVLPPAVAGLALLVAFGRRGPFGPLLESAGVSLPFSTAAVILAQVFVAAPFFVRTAQVGFAGISPEVVDAARVDGAAGLVLFRYVTLPLAIHALAAGLALSWARALGEFGATILFAGNLSGRTQTMPLLVYSVFERDIGAAIWAGLLLVGMALAALLASQWLLRKAPPAN